MHTKKATENEHQFSINFIFSFIPFYNTDIKEKDIHNFVVVATAACYLT